MKNGLKFLLILTFALLLPGFALAFDIKADENSNIIDGDQVIDDDVIITGGTVEVDGTINGDLKAFGANVVVSGEVNGDVMAFGSSINIKGLVFGDVTTAGGMVTINGEITDDLIAAGGNVNLEGEVRDNVILAGGMLNVADQAKIGRDLLIGGGTVTIAGEVKRNVTFGAGQLSILGEVGGNVSGEADEDVEIGSKAEILGNLEYKSSKEANVNEGAQVAGENKWTQIEKDNNQKSFLSKALGKVYSGLALLVVAVVAVLLFPKKSEEVIDNINSKPGKSFLYGLILLLIAPFVIVIVAVTILGIPLAIILGVFYGILLYVSKIYVGLWAGKRILDYLKSKNKNQLKTLVLPVILGIFVMWILFIIPFVGFIVKIVATIFGMGAITVCLLNYYNERKGKRVVKKATAKK